VPWYGEWILSFPKAPRGSVSIMIWQYACSAVIGMVFEAVGALFALYVISTSKKASKTRKTEVPVGAEKKAK
jgi:hypothetical protein